LFFGEVFGSKNGGNRFLVSEESSAAQNQARRRCVNGLAFSPL
jgi:hypothetical protein